MADAAQASVGSPAPGGYGAGGAALQLTAIAIGAAWNLQGRPSRPQFVAVARDMCGVTLPVAPNTTARSAAWTAFWLGHESWLLVAHGSSRREDFTAWEDALNPAGGALFEVSAARVAYRVRGERAASVLAKTCPLDFDARSFALGGCAQSLFGRAGALFHRRDATSWTVMVGRSFARDTWHTLCQAAAQYGYEVTAAEAFC